MILSSFCLMNTGFDSAFNICEDSQLKNEATSGFSGFPVKMEDHAGSVEK